MVWTRSAGRVASLLTLLAMSACAPDGADLVGTWEPTADTLAARYTFFADGRARIVARMPGGAPQLYEARYTLTGDSLLTLSDPQGAERFRVRATQDTLWLQSPVTGLDTRLVRVPLR